MRNPTPKQIVAMIINLCEILGIAYEALKDADPVGCNIRVAAEKREAAKRVRLGLEAKRTFEAVEASAPGEDAS